MRQAQKKSIITAALIALLTTSVGYASADDNDRYQRYNRLDLDRDGRVERWERNRWDRDRDGRVERWERNRLDLDRDGRVERWELNRLDRDRDGRVERWELNRGPSRQSYYNRNNRAYDRYSYRDQYDR